MGNQYLAKEFQKVDDIKDHGVNMNLFKFLSTKKETETKKNQKILPLLKFGELYVHIF